MPLITIIDDDQDFAEAIAAVLESAGHEVDLQLTPSAGMASLKAKKPNLAILDVMFPENPTAGFDTAREIRKDENLKDIPVIMLTSVNQEFPLGFSDKEIDKDWLPVTTFIEKPVDFGVLLRKVAELLDSGKA